MDLIGIICEDNTAEMEDDHSYCTTEAIIERNPNESKVSWTFTETKALIKSVETHYECLNHPVRRKNMWNNVSTDLESISILRSNKQCADKWKNLVRSYKCCKDNNKKTGRGPTRFMFYDMMDELLGTKPNISCAHTIAVGATKNNEVNIFHKPNNTPFETVETSEEVFDNSSGSSVTIKSKKRKVSGNDDYLKMKTFIEEKKLEETILENKRKDDRYKNRMEWMNRKLDLEEKKLNVFEKYFHRQGI